MLPPSSQSPSSRTTSSAIVVLLSLILLPNSHFIEGTSSHRPSSFVGPLPGGIGREKFVARRCSVPSLLSCPPPFVAPIELSMSSRDGDESMAMSAQDQEEAYHFHAEAEALRKAAIAARLEADMADATLMLEKVNRIGRKIEEGYYHKAKLNEIELTEAQVQFIINKLGPHSDHHHEETDLHP